ncbi:MAG: hypothetical protein H6Q00_1399 [Holophagaceae bacterium]|nr:hypothetical protein [Holophagaceae bacterium]
MKKREAPSGFVATCRCGEVVGAMDIDRTPQPDKGRILGEWLYHGCTVSPRWGSWSITLGACKCEALGREK